MDIIAGFPYMTRFYLPCNVFLRSGEILQLKFEAYLQPIELKFCIHI